ncbi:hypothetical protein D6C88_09487, partial [Aureobasidium pullulans]
SRRRRVSKLSSSRIPFEQLPLQCFQEARKVLNQHRQKKVEDIEAERQKIARLETAPVEPQNKQQHQHRIDSMECYLGTTPDSRRHQRPHGQEEKWRQYARMIIMQRITQMNVVPDVLPAIDPTLNVDISFDPHDVQPGGFFRNSLPTLTSNPRTRGERYVRIANVNHDVPNVEEADAFDYRCHFLASNIEIPPKQDFHVPRQAER